MIRLAYTPNPLEPWRHRTGQARAHQSLDAAIHEAFPDAPELTALGIVLNGVRVETPAGRFAAPGDVVQVWRVPQGPGLAFGIPATLTDVVLSGLFVFFSTNILKRLMPSIPEAADPTPEGPTYSFSGIGTERIEGRPIGVIYGEMRTGGQLINEFIENDAGHSGHSTYAAQLSLGDGPIYAIGDITTPTPKNEPLSTEGFFGGLPTGILIEGNNAANLDEVEVHVRLGNAEQQAELGFQFLETRNDVGTELLQVEADLDPAEIDHPLITLGDSVLTQDAAWDTYGVTFDLTADTYDAVRITFRMPQGYLKINSNNGVKVAVPFWHMIRYQELDASNNPITTGGAAATDGWVRWPERRNVYLSESPFSVDFVYPFYDPAEWDDGVTLGYSLDLNGSVVSDCVVAASATKPAVPTAWGPSNTVFDSFTFETWFEIDTLADGAAVNTLFDVADLSVGGLRVRVLQMSYAPFPGETVTRWVPVFEVFDPYKRWFEGVDLNNDAQGIGEPTFTITQGERYHLAITYKNDPDGTGSTTKDRLRIYGNGELLQEWVENINLKLPTGASTPTRWAVDTHFGLNPALSNSMDGRMDECWVIHAERSHEQIALDYNYGIGRRAKLEWLDFTNVVFGYHFDDNVAGGGTTNDFGAFSNDATLGSSGSNTQGQGWIIKGFSDETPLRAKFRVQVMRDNYLSIQTGTINDVELEAVSGIVDEAFSYPGEARMSLMVRASEQLSTGIPQITAKVKGRKCPYWDGIDPTYPTYGYAWTRNPAWACLDMIINKRLGMGQLFDSQEDVDVQSVKDFADFCDEVVTDHLGDFKSNRDNPTQGDLGGDTDGWIDMYFDPTTLDDHTGELRGSIEISFGTTGSIPTHWKVGEAVRWSGMQIDDSAHPSIYLDTNYPNVAGWEIKSITRSWTSTVVVYYDQFDANTERAPWSPATGGYIRTGLGTEAPTGIIEGAEKRFQYDADLRVAKPAWDQLIETAGTARAVPVLEGSRVRFRLNRARTPVAFVGIGNIIEGSFEIQYANSDPINAYTVEFLDEDLDYDRSTEYDEHPSIQNAASLDEVRVESLMLVGVTRRSQAHRHARYLLNSNYLLMRAGRWKASVDQIHFEVGDTVWLSHDLVDWGLGGRILDDSVSTNLDVTLDRQVVLAAATTYYLRVRNAETGDFETAQIASAAGTYTRGTTITLSTAFTFTPQKGDPYLFYEDGDEFTADITAVSLNEDFTVEVEWVEYDAAVYDDDFGSLTAQPPVNNQPAMSVDRVIPDNVGTVRVVESAPRSAQGTEEATVTVSWTADATNRSRTARYALWWKIDNVNSGLFRRGVEVHGSEMSASLRVPGVQIGDAVVVAVQPISHSGVTRGPERCAQGRTGIHGISAYPVGPTNFAATMQGGLITYSWTIAPGEEHNFHEIRRGGWVLGQVVAVAPPGQSSVTTSNWASGPANQAGVSDPTLYLRSRTTSGRYSTVAQELVAVLNPVKFTTHGGLATSAEAFYASQSWEDYANDWTGGAYGAAVTDLQVNSDGELEFAGSGLTGYYESAVPSTAMMDKMRIDPVFIEAHTVAYQVHPVAWEELPWAWGDPLMQRMTWEGPIDQPISGETLPCSVTIEISVKPDKDTAWTGWKTYEPGVYTGIGFKYRLVVTRPNTDYDVRISRFATRIKRVPATRWEQPPGVRFGYAELFN